VTDDEITTAQRRIGRRAVVCRTRTDFRRCARWWELEARRGYASSQASMEYARNMRWCAELTETYGPGTWLELSARAEQTRVR
jgi:hypothetical protein